MYHEAAHINPNPNQLVLPHHYETPRVFPILRIVEPDIEDNFLEQEPLFYDNPPEAA